MISGAIPNFVIANEVKQSQRLAIASLHYVSLAMTYKNKVNKYQINPQWQVSETQTPHDLVDFDSTTILNKNLKPLQVTV